MPTFRYKAYKPDGRDVSGAVDAENLREASVRLKKEGLLPREITPADDAPAGGSGFQFKRGTGLPQLALMTRRLATLLGSAVPIYEAASTLWEQEPAGELKQVLGRIRDRLAEGAALAKCMSLEPQVFSESYVSMVSAGEASGALDLVLDRLADFLEGQEQLKSKVSTSLAYPLLMVLVGGGVMLFLLGFVIPKITTVFADNKAALPMITVLLLKTSELLRKGWWVLLILAGGTVYCYRRLIRQEPMRLKRDSLLLRIPLVGALNRQLILARFAKVLGLLLSSGVPVIKALEITGEAVVNRAYRASLTLTRAELIEGGKLSASLGKTPLYPPLLIHMIAVGERSGTLEAMLEKAGNAFEREFETAVTRFMALLEPLLVLGMGLAVGFVVIAVLLPIFQLNQLIK